MTGLMGQKGVSEGRLPTQAAEQSWAWEGPRAAGLRPIVLLAPRWVRLKSLTPMEGAGWLLGP